MDSQGSPVHLLVFSADALADGYGSAAALRTFLKAALAYSDWHITLVELGPAEDLPSSPPARLRRVAIGGRPSRNRLTQLGSYAVRAMVYSAVAALQRPDVVLSWQPLPAALAGATASMRYRCPHLVRTCGPELARAWSRFPGLTSALGPLTSRLLAGAQTVVIKSEVERNLLPRRVEAHRVRMIPNAVGAEFFVPQRDRASLDLQLLTVCQLEPHKRVMRLISTLAAGFPVGVRLTVAGDGSQRSRLERAASTAGVRVRFLGRVARADLPALYAAHDALVVPSVLEGCSNAVLEAMAAGLPVIGYRSALSDLVEDGISGILSESPDTAGLRWAIERFLEAGAMADRMRAASRRRAEAHSPRRLFTAYRDLLEDLRGRRPPSLVGGSR